MVWLMVLIDGLLPFHVINGKFKSANYIAILDRFVVPIIRINVKLVFFFQ